MSHFTEGSPVWCAYFNNECKKKFSHQLYYTNSLSLSYPRGSLYWTKGMKNKSMNLIYGQNSRPYSSLIAMLFLVKVAIDSLLSKWIHNGRDTHHIHSFLSHQLTSLSLLACLVDLSCKERNCPSSSCRGDDNRKTTKCYEFGTVYFIKY